MENQVNVPEQDLRRMVAEIVTALVRNTPVPAEKLPEVVRAVYTSLTEVSGAKGQEKAAAAGPQPVQKPAVPVRKSVAQDHLVCLECGQKFKLLKRHLRTAHNMTQAEYRAKWNLPFDYPIVAPAYADKRSTLAKELGLGRTPKRMGQRKGPRKQGQTPGQNPKPAALTAA